MRVYIEITGHIKNHQNFKILFWSRDSKKQIFTIFSGTRDAGCRVPDAGTRDAGCRVPGVLLPRDNGFSVLRIFLTAYPLSDGPIWSML